MDPDTLPDIVVLGASAGGVPAFQDVVTAFPANFNAAIFVVLHLAAESESFLPRILTRSGDLPAVHPNDGDPVAAGRIYCAPPDHHLFLQDSRMRVLRGPKENLHRPSIDVLFRSAAIAFNRRVIGVLMTGGDDDGAAGLKAIQECGGIAVVQDPSDCLHPEMPQSALRLLKPDFVVPIGEIGPLVRDLVAGAVRPERRSSIMSEPVEKSDADNTGLPRPEDSHMGHPAPKLPGGGPTSFSCPECNGTLWELQDGEILRYRCRVGHAYTAQSIIEAESDAVDRAIWEAIRVLEESASMSRRIAQKTPPLRERLLKRAQEREGHAKVLRNLAINDPESR